MNFHFNTRLLVDMPESLLPTVTSIINKSFRQSVIQSELKAALVSPLIKKTHTGSRVAAELPPHIKFIVPPRGAPTSAVSH